MNKNTMLRYLFYFGGFFVTAMGITTILRSGLGAGAWDTVNYNFRALTGITLGTASMSINIVIMLILVLYNKSARFFLTVIPIVLIGLFIDLWDLVIYADYEPATMMMRLTLYVVGVLILTSGLTLTITSGYPAMVFDELTLMMMKVFRTESFFKARLFVELLAIVIATGLGFAAGIGFGAVNVGSFLLAVALPPILSRQLDFVRPRVPFQVSQT
ncbi:MAG: YczE/YyaS/YitT family protein [Bacillota bacterium]